MSERSVGFKLVKYIYIVLLVLGLFSSAVLFVVGLCALTDNGENRHIYENFMKYYGIDELDFQPVFNKTHYLNRFNFDEDNYDKQSKSFRYQIYSYLYKKILFQKNYKIYNKTRELIIVKIIYKSVNYCLNRDFIVMYYSLSAAEGLYSRVREMTFLLNRFSSHN